jgi:hypothetical protein
MNTYTHSLSLFLTPLLPHLRAQDVRSVVDAMNQSALAALDELLTPVSSAPNLQPTATPAHTLPLQAPMSSAGSAQHTPVPLTVFAVRATPSPVSVGVPVGWSPSWVASAAGEAFLSHGMQPSHATSDEK